MATQSSHGIPLGDVQATSLLDPSSTNSGDAFKTSLSRRLTTINRPPFCDIIYRSLRRICKTNR
jgi:hypothetical protein